MDLSEQVKTAIGAHGLWKSRLRAAIDTGKSNATVADVRNDHICDFGKWLYGLDAQSSKSQECGTSKELHAKFHAAAATVLSLALEGKKQQALAAIGPESEFSKVSAKLTQALMAWSSKA